MKSYVIEREGKSWVLRRSGSLDQMIHGRGVSVTSSYADVFDGLAASIDEFGSTY